MKRAGEAGAGADLDQLRRRLLERDAEDAAIGAVSAAPSSLGASLGAGQGSASVEGRQVGQQIKQRASDHYERKVHDRGQHRLQHEAVKLDIEADREALAGTMLRLKERPALQQPTQSLLTTAAAERKSRVRAQRQVPKKNGSAAGGFGNLPHPGLWKAQPLDPVQGRTAPPPSPTRAAPARQTVTVS